jgi:hypothetical protein
VIVFMHVADEDVSSFFRHTSPDSDKKTPSHRSYFESA